MSFIDDLRKGLDDHQDQLKDIYLYLRGYLKNPVDAIKNVPNWEWPVILGFYTVAAAACGLLSGVISLKFIMIVTGLLFFPISALVCAFILSGFFYYTFSFFYHRQFDFKNIFSIVALSFLPFFALYTLSGLLSAVNLVGFAASAVLLTVGLSEYTQLDKRKIVKLIIGLYAIYLIFWMVNVITWTNENKVYKKLATPESYEQLTKELGN